MFFASLINPVFRLKSPKGRLDPSQPLCQQPHVVSRARMSGWNQHWLHEINEKRFTLRGGGGMSSTIDAIGSAELGAAEGSREAERDVTRRTSLRRGGPDV